MLKFEDQSFNILTIILFNREEVLNNVTRISILVIVVLGNMYLAGYNLKQICSRKARWIHYIWICEIVYFIHIFVFSQENPDKPFAWMDDATMFLYLAEAIIAIKKLEKITNLDLSFLLKSFNALTENKLNKNGAVKEDE